MRAHCIYVHVNKENGKCYVGQSINIKERWSRSGSRYKDSPRFWKAIQKYGWDSFEHIILEQELTQDEANNREIFWISLLNTTDENCGYNLATGGNNYQSILWQNEEYKEKMHKAFSCSRKVLWQNADFSKVQQDKMQAGVQAFWNDPEKRNQRIQNIIGDKNPNSKQVRNIETGLIFSTIKEASAWCGLNAVSCIGQNCRGKVKSAGRHPKTGEKLHWEYVEGGGFENEGEQG